MDSLLDRFFRYISFDTRANRQRKTLPSNPSQLELVRLLSQELKLMGLEDVQITKTGCLIATLPANCSKDIPVVAFVAHSDTSPDMAGVCQKSQYILNYQGKDIVLGNIGHEILSPAMYPELNQLRNHHLITSDGAALLGASGKASIAELMTALSLIQSSSLLHGEVKVIILPDQTLSLSIKQYALPPLRIDRAYVFESGGLGAMSIENLNVTRATIKIYGRSSHNHVCYNVMVNALAKASNLHALLATHQCPTSTNYFDGFVHLTHLSGSVEYAEMTYLICHFDDVLLQQQVVGFNQMVELAKSDLLSGCYMTLRMQPIARNRYEQLIRYPDFIEATEQAIRETGHEPYRFASRNPCVMSSPLSVLGVPCIAIANGGYNYHSRHEFVSVQQMESCVNLIVNIVRLAAKG